jgi:ribosomal protein S18 acetylase RimI-like enzyme
MKRVKAQIRPMTLEDKPSVMRMLRDMPEFRAAEVLVAEEVIDSYLSDPLKSGYHILVAETESSIAGYICYGPTPLTEGTWDIYWLAVSPERQRQGIGKNLIAFAEAAILQSKGRMAIIETSSLPIYKPAIHFYSRRGYELGCRIADFCAAGDDKLVLIKRLS